MNKKIIAITTSLCLILTMIPSVALANDNTSIQDNSTNIVKAIKEMDLSKTFINEITYQANGESNILKDVSFFSKIISFFRNIIKGIEVNKKYVSFEGDGSGRTFDDYAIGTIFQINPSGEYDYPLYIVAGDQDSDSYGGPLTGKTYTVHIESAYYTLTAKNSINDKSKYYFTEKDGYQYVPYEVIVSIRAKTDPLLAGSQITFYFNGDRSGFCYQGYVKNDGTISIDWEQYPTNNPVGEYQYSPCFHSPEYLVLDHLSFRYYPAQ